MKVNGPACNFVDDFRSRHGTVEQIFAGLKLISATAVEDVRKRRITIGNDFFPREESNDTTRAEAVRNLDKTTLGRVSNNTPLSARVERKSPQTNTKNQMKKRHLFNGFIINGFTFRVSGSRAAILT